MNALDFLVDFAALVSTSEASRPGYDGNDIDQNVDLARRKLDSAPDICITSSEELSPLNRKQPVNTVQLQCSMEPSLSRQSFSNHVVNHPTSNTQYHGPYEGFFPVPTDPDMSQSFDHFPYQHLGLGFPCATTNDMRYLACDCEQIAHWDPSYEMGYSLPAEPASWIHVQLQHQPPNHDVRFLEAQLVLPAEGSPTKSSQCMDAACDCQHPPPYQALSNDYAPVVPIDIWGHHISVYDKRISKENDEWMWMSARGQPEMSRM